MNTATHQVERVYVGVNREGANDDLIRGLLDESIGLEQADDRLIVPFLLRRRREAKKRNFREEATRRSALTQ